MTCETFTKTKFRPATLLMISQANAILEEYAAQGFTLTVRQLFYQFVARDLIGNTLDNYKLISRTMVNGRQGGLVDWDHLEDRRPEVWIEKSAVLGLVEPACSRWRVPYTACRGVRQP